MRRQAARTGRQAARTGRVAQWSELDVSPGVRRVEEPRNQALAGHFAGPGRGRPNGSPVGTRGRAGRSLELWVWWAGGAVAGGATVGEIVAGEILAYKAVVDAAANEWGR